MKIFNIFKKHTISDFNLKDLCKLRFQKDDYSTYCISFYNPVLKSWWILPKEDVSIHGRWTLLNKGSYGAYDIGILQCEYSEVQHYKNKFKTIGDIKIYFDEMNKKYDEWLDRRKKDNELPSIIN